MMRLHTIRTFAALACVISFLGIYMVRTVCVAEDIMQSDSYLVSNSQHETRDKGGLHEHHTQPPNDDDDCCTDVTVKYFASFQSTLPSTTVPVLIAAFVAYSTEHPFFQLYDNHSHSSPSAIREGPPLPFYTGVGIRIMIQSFLH
jgi:hypothetical protein